MAVRIGLTLLASLLWVSLAMAAEPAGAAAAGSAASLAQYFSYAVLAAGIGIGIAAFGTGIGQGLAIHKSVEGVARNPEASGKITVTMLIGLAMVESLCIYALVVALIILYAYPMTKPIAAALGLKV
ncbi:MAG: ATP synthase F0 subunit C [Deltaproteobacteria bacterium]|nr:ATP synthase F0 subunit C [Deltaproteobacteria bacterium]